MTSKKQPLAHARHGPGWPLVGLLAAVVAAVTAGWFLFAGALGGSDQDETSRYVEAVVGAPARVNPLFVHLNDVDRDVASLVFSGLTRLGPDGEVLPDLAESWEVSRDQLEVTFHLRTDVTWHNASSFDSADVLFTYELLANQEMQTDPDQAPLWREVECEAPDAHTVVCRLPEPYSPFLSFTSIGILPHRLLEEVEPQALFEDPFNLAPVGTGPFRLLRVDQSSATLRANSRYHLGEPQLTEIVLQFYPDAASAAADVVRGEVDGILTDLSTNLNDYETLSSISGFRRYTSNRTAYTVLYLNNTAPILADRSIRTAISLAVDIDSIIGELLGGRAVRADSPIVPGTWAYNPDLNAPSRDLRLAQRILDEAGWEVPDDSDIRERNGTELRFPLMTDQDQLRGVIAETIAAQLAEIGIDASVVREPSTSFVREFLIPRLYQAAIFGWDPGADPDPYPAWHSSQATGNGRNLAAYSSQEADQLMEIGRRTYVMETREAAYNAFQEIFVADVPSVLLYYPVHTYFVTDAIRNLQIGTLFHGSSRFANAHEWSYERTPDLRDQ